MQGPTGPMGHGPVFLKNHYKNMVFGGPNHSHSDRLSQAVILVRWHILGMLPKPIVDENLKKHKKIHQKTLKTRSNLGPRPPGPLPSVQTPKKKNRLNGIPNGPILKGFVTILHKIIKKSLPERPRPPAGRPPAGRPAGQRPASGRPAGRPS